ncbi:uncharacterized protein [Arachis hypogaea]|uniref:uncharacterized protein n=1 Tax=Arachis hypogaea TaxID=3818 RepID=UPI003B217B93
MTRLLSCVDKDQQKEVRRDAEGIWRFKGKICVPESDNLRQEILREAHHGRFSIHPGLLRTTSENDSIWVIVDKLTKSAHFLPIRMDYSMERLAQLYVREIVRLHGVPTSIVLDRDPRFTSRFWRAFQKAFETRLHMSTTYHPQMDGQSERTIQTLEDMLRACVLDQKGSWERYLSLVEFAYNNSFHASIGMAPYEALYDRKCQSPLCWYEGKESSMMRPELVQETTKQIKRICERILTAQSRQKSYADRRRKPLEFTEGDHVFLKVTPTTGVGRSLKTKKLSPRFIGPFQILKRVGSVAYQIALLPYLSNLHDVFHIFQLRKYNPDESHVLEPKTVQLRDDLTFRVLPVQIVDRSIKQLRGKEVSLVKVAWGRDGMEEHTWELESTMKTDYPQLSARSSAKVGTFAEKKGEACGAPITVVSSHTIATTVGSGDLQAYGFCPISWLIHNYSQRLSSLGSQGGWNNGGLLWRVVTSTEDRESNREQNRKKMEKEPLEPDGFAVEATIPQFVPIFPIMSSSSSSSPRPSPPSWWGIVLASILRHHHM